MTTRAIPLGAPEYPPLLAAAPDPPPVLYVLGDPAVLLAPQVAVIGTRKAGWHGRRLAHRVGATLVMRGVVVTSGAAVGIDGEAHRGALDSDGRTVAALAHGLHMVYPAHHRALAEQIERRGCLVSEHPDGTAPSPGAFVRRDRIQSGLARAVVLVESNAKGGSFHTLWAAKKQRRPIFAVWSEAEGFQQAGAERARDEFGATLVRSVGELWEALAPLVREGGR